eukprot:3859486-Rhodomonas_salina.1
MVQLCCLCFGTVKPGFEGWVPWPGYHCYQLVPLYQHNFAKVATTRTTHMRRPTGVQGQHRAGGGISITISRTGSISERTRGCPSSAASTRLWYRTLVPMLGTGRGWLRVTSRPGVGQRQKEVVEGWGHDLQCVLNFHPFKRIHYAKFHLTKLIEPPAKKRV